MRKARAENLLKLSVRGNPFPFARINENGEIDGSISRYRDP
jgi:hypothetical protein